jgi:hypothetical protein
MSVDRLHDFPWFDLANNVARTESIARVGSLRFRIAFEVEEHVTR